MFELIASGEIETSWTVQSEPQCGGVFCRSGKLIGSSLASLPLGKNERYHEPEILGSIQR
jgi:hypothetical protein